MKYETGFAIFLPLENSLWSMRKSTKQALLDHHPMRRYKVMDEILYYPGMIDHLLQQPDSIHTSHQSTQEMICGEENGALNCISLVEMTTNQGILLHRSEGKLIAACLPFPSYEEAYKEYQLILELSSFAEKAEGMDFYLSESLPSGNYSLKEFLLYIAQSMK